MSECYFESIGHHSKTDKQDAIGIAELSCERSFKLWEPISVHVRELRAMLRHRKTLIKRRTQYKNNLHAIKSSALDFKKIRKSLEKTIKFLDKEILKIEEEAIKLSKEDVEFYDKVTMISDSVSGLGVLSVLVIVSETNGFKEIKSSKQLESYVGLDIVENSSGQHIGKTKISKRGNVHLRSVLHMPSVNILSKKTGLFYNLYKRLVKRNGGIRKKAMVAMQRKLLVIVYKLWKKNEPFDKEYELKRMKKSPILI